MSHVMMAEVLPMDIILVSVSNNASGAASEHQTLFLSWTWAEAEAPMTLIQCGAELKRCMTAECI